MLKSNEDVQLNLHLGVIDDWALDKPSLPEDFIFEPIEISCRNQHWLNIIRQVVESGMHNKDGCRIRVNDKWNFTLLCQMLHDYHDQEVLDFLEFGWPIHRAETPPLELGG